VLVNRSTGETLASRVCTCDTFWSRLRGLMFRRALDPGQAYVFCYGRESVADMTIHMFFVTFAISVLWLDADKRVVDKALARPFRPYYAPQSPAQYLIEGAPDLLDRVRIGDELDLEGDWGK